MSTRVLIHKSQHSPLDICQDHFIYATELPGDSADPDLILHIRTTLKLNVARFHSSCICFDSNGAIDKDQNYLFTLTWWVHEVEVHQVINTQLLQLQHHRAQVRPQDLWICVVLRQARGTRKNPESISNVLVSALVISSCVAHMSTWESTAFEGLFNLFFQIPFAPQHDVKELPC